MRANLLLCLCAAMAMAGSAAAQKPARQSDKQPPAPALPYKPVAITPPQPITDDSFEAMRKQLAEAAQHKDRAAMMRLVVAQGFFWDRDNRNAADRRKNGFDNLSAALGLNSKEGVGWDILTGYAEDPTASLSRWHKDAMCAPAEPAFDGKAFDELIKTTNSGVTEWGYPLSPELEVHARPQSNALAIDKVGLHFVRIMPENGSNPPSFMRIATPAGKIGYVSIDSIAPIGNDQICYVKDAGGWKIGGYVGGGEPP